MKTLLSKAFWDYAFERAIKTVSQTAIALIGTTALFDGVDWVTVLSGSGLAGVVSVLTSLASDWKTPSTIKEDEEVLVDEEGEVDGLVS